MRFRHSFRFLSLLGLAAAPLTVSPLLSHDQELSAQEPAGVEGGPEAVVRELYDMVTFPAGTTPDWDEFRTLFLPGSVVVLRTSREGTSVFTLEEFVQDWLRFIEGSDVEASGFTERILRTHTIEFGDIAHVWVLYEAEIPGRDRPAQAGVDSFQLVRRDGVWKIASILNEIPAPGRPIPQVLRGKG